MSGNGARPKRARADWYADVMRLLALGWTHQQIADELNISRSFVRELLYDPDGSKAIARKQRYRRPCPRLREPDERQRRTRSERARPLRSMQ